MSVSFPPFFPSSPPPFLLLPLLPTLFPRFFPPPPPPFPYPVSRGKFGWAEGRREWGKNVGRWKGKKGTGGEGEKWNAVKTLVKPLQPKPTSLFFLVPTTSDGMQKWKLSWNMHALRTRFCTFGADLYAQSVLNSKISASELSPEFIKSVLLVGLAYLSTLLFLSPK